MAQSFHATPSSHATGAKITPKICCSDAGNQPNVQAVHASRGPPLTIAISARNAINIAADVQRQLQTVARAARRRVDHVDAGLLHFDFARCRRWRASPVSGIMHLGEHDGRGAVMITAVSRCVISTCAIITYAAITAPETCAMPLVMMVNNSDLRQSGQERPDGQRRFRLAHEDAGGDAGRFGAAGAHDPLHHHSHAANEHLHHAELVQHGKQRRDEDDDRQYLEREHHAELDRLSRPAVAEQNWLPASAYSSSAFTAMLAI